MRVYVVWDEADDPIAGSNPASELRDHLDRMGFEVKLPLGGDSTSRERREDNKEKLKQVDAVLLYWGNTSQAWVEARLRELEQALGWRRARPFRAKAAYLAVPRNPYKDRFRTREVEVLIKQFDRFSPTDLEDFVQRARGAADAR